MEEKLNIPYEEKSKGNELFKENKIEEASKCYSKALLGINFLFKEHSIEEEIGLALVREVQVPCLLNLAACYLKMGKGYETAINHCTEVLKIDETNIKAYYRRAQANYYLANHEESMKDIAAAKKIDPDNPALAELAKKIKESVLKYKEKSKRIAMKAFHTQKQPSLFRRIFCCKRRNS